MSRAVAKKAVARKKRGSAVVVKRDAGGRSLPVEKPAEALSRVRRGERVILRRGGKSVAAVVSLSDLELLEELEDRYDLELARQALSEPGPSIPYEEVRRKLGLS